MTTSAQTAQMMHKDRSPGMQVLPDRKPRAFNILQEELCGWFQKSTGAGQAITLYIPSSYSLGRIVFGTITEDPEIELQDLSRLLHAESSTTLSGVLDFPTITLDPEIELQDLSRPFHAESSTVQQEIPVELRARAEDLFRGAADIQFEDGMENEFSKGLILFIRQHGNAAINSLAELILSERLSPSVSSEALRWLGDIDDSSTYQRRLWLLEKSLACSSPVVRDGAVLGLASLDDPHAIPYLQKARSTEIRRELRKDLDQVLEQLQETR